MRIIFAGTPEFACPALTRLIHSKYEVVAVYSQPDRPKGRNRKLTISPVKELAIKHNIPIEQPENFANLAVQQKFANYQPDIFIVAAYGLILPQTILDYCQYNINIHASLLPKWRGAAPIQHAIMAGDAITGITIMQIVKELDAGDMINQASIPITQTASTGTLAKELAELGSQLLLDTLDDLDNLWLAKTAQNKAYASYAGKITKEMFRINWHHNANTINQQIRALHPKAQTNLQADIIKVTGTEITNNKSTIPPGNITIADNKMYVATSDFDLMITELQFPSKRPMPASAAICGYKNLLQAFS